MSNYPPGSNTKDAPWIARDNFIICEDCDGLGKFDDEECKSCDGTGLVEKDDGDEFENKYLGDF